MEKQFVPINYKTAVGKEICVTVTVEVKELLAQSDRQIQSQWRQDRRHLTEYIDNLAGTAMAAPLSDPADLLEKKEREQQLHEAMECLTPTQQRRLELLFFTSLSYSQITKLEGVSDKSVAESVAQALKKTTQEARYKITTLRAARNRVTLFVHRIKSYK